MKQKATVTFFKPSGKFYAEEIYEFANVEDEAYEIFEQIENYFYSHYKGMHMVVNFDDTYDKGYPFMQPANMR